MATLSRTRWIALSGRSDPSDCHPAYASKVGMSFRRDTPTSSAPGPSRKRANDSSPSTSAPVPIPTPARAVKRPRHSDSDHVGLVLDARCLPHASALPQAASVASPRAATTNSISLSSSPRLPNSISARGLVGCDSSIPSDGGAKDPRDPKLESASAANSRDATSSPAFGRLPTPISNPSPYQLDPSHEAGRAIAAPSLQWMLDRHLAPELLSYICTAILSTPSTKLVIPLPNVFLALSLLRGFLGSSDHALEPRQEVELRILEGRVGLEYLKAVSETKKSVPEGTLQREGKEIERGLSRGAVLCQKHNHLASYSATFGLLQSNVSVLTVRTISQAIHGRKLRLTGLSSSSLQGNVKFAIKTLKRSIADHSSSSVILCIV